MVARLRAVLRLLSLQASYTYERLQGVGMAVAQAPLLAPLATQDPARAREARGRSGQYFNAHPFLAGIAVGAQSRAELDGQPGDRILRLRTALSGPLGALGDQLFWAGVVPALMGLALMASALGQGIPVLFGLLLGYNLVRVYVTDWGVRLGLRNGLNVATDLSHSLLRPAAGAVAGLIIGAAIPWVAWWLLGGAGRSGQLVLMIVAVAIVVGVLTRQRPLSAPGVTLGAAALTLVWRWTT